MEGYKLPAGKVTQGSLPIALQSVQLGKQGRKVFCENIRLLRIAGGKPGADVFRHDAGIGRGEPDVGILLMVVPFVFFRVMEIFVFFFVFFRADKGNAGGGVDDLFFIDDPFQEVLQSGAGNHNGLCCLGSLYLTDIQGVIVETGDWLRNQPGHGQTGALAEPLGKFRHRQCGGGNIGAGGAAAPGQGKHQRGEK